MSENAKLRPITGSIERILKLKKQDLFSHIKGSFNVERQVDDTCSKEFVATENLSAEEICQQCLAYEGQSDTKKHLPAIRLPDNMFSVEILKGAKGINETCYHYLKELNEEAYSEITCGSDNIRFYVRVIQNLDAIKFGTFQIEGQVIIVSKLDYIVLTGYSHKYSGFKKFNDATYLTLQSYYQSYNPKEVTTKEKVEPEPKWENVEDIYRSTTNVTELKATPKKSKASSSSESGSCHSARFSDTDIQTLKSAFDKGTEWNNQPSPSGHGSPTCFGILFGHHNWVTVKDFGYEWKREELWSMLNVTPLPYKREDELGEKVEYDRYIYLDENGKPFHWKIRCRYLDEQGEWVKKDGKTIKRDSWQHKDSQGQVVDTMQKDSDKKAIHILYHLPFVLAALQNGDPIWVPEGEKDADTVATRFGHVATSGDSGRDFWRNEWVETLTSGKTIEFIIPFDLDEDRGGEKFAWKKAFSLHRKNPKCKIKLISFTPHKDVTDWVEAGGTQQELNDLIAKVPYLTIDDFKEADFQFDFFAGQYIERLGNFYYVGERELWKADLYRYYELKEEIASCEDDEVKKKLERELQEIVQKRFRIGNWITPESSDLDSNNENVGITLKYLSGAEVIRTYHVMLTDLVDYKSLWAFVQKSDYRLEARRNRDLFEFIIQEHNKRKTRILRVNQIGWQGKTYVLPDRVIGPDKIAFATTEVAARFGMRGTLRDWQDNVFKYMVGNSVGLFACSMAFGAVTLGACDYPVQNLVINLFGGTSVGKSAFQRVTVSIIGCPRYFIQLTGTDKGLNDIPRLHNHSLVIMDDLAKLGDAVVPFMKDFSFLFEGGQQRLRLSQTGDQRNRDIWRTFALLSYEKSSLDAVGYDKLQGGHFVRFIDIPVLDIGSYGAFEDTYGMSGKDFAKMLELNVTKYYGTALQAYVEGIQANWDESVKFLQEQSKKFDSLLLQGQNASCEVMRVTAIIAHILASGELAVKLGVFGNRIKPGQMFQAGQKVTDVWIEWRGGIKTKFDDTRILEKLKTHLDTETSMYGWIVEGAVESQDFGMNMENVQNAISGNAVVTEEATRNFKAGYRYVGKLKNHYALISVSYFKNELYKGENMKYVLKLLEENYVLIRRDADHVSWTVRNLHVDTLSKLEPATAKFYKIDYDVLS